MTEMQGVEHPADGTVSETVFNDFIWTLCNGTLIVESYGEYNSPQHRVRINNKLRSYGPISNAIDMSWEQWEDLKEAIFERSPVQIIEDAPEVSGLHYSRGSIDPEAEFLRAADQFRGDIGL